MDINQDQESSHVQPKQTAAVGNRLYLVEGAIRWGLYDLMTGTLTSMDQQSGNLLNHLSQTESITSMEKRLFLQQYSPAIWDQILGLRISERLFEPDVSVGPNDISLDILWLEVTDRCNERCIHCYAESSPRRKTSMTIGLAREIIRQGREEGFRKIQFVGGEPFAHRQLWEMIEYAHGLDYPEIEIFTNLVLAKEIDFERIHVLGIKIATSLFGYNAATHEACTKTHRSFQRWYRNIKRVQALGISYRIGVIRMRQNENLMDDIEKFLRDEKLLGQGELFDPDDVRPLGRGDDSIVRPVKPLDYELFLTINPRFFHNARQYNSCWRGEIAVATNGDVFPCVFSRNFAVGNLNKESLRSVIERLKETCWKITLDMIDKCRDCELRYACIDCRALSLGAGKGLYGSPVRCNYDPFR